jgi:hypothetical protein
MIEIPKEDCNGSAFFFWLSDIDSKKRGCAIKTDFSNLTEFDIKYLHMFAEIIGVANFTSLTLEDLCSKIKEGINFRCSQIHHHHE